MTGHLQLLAILFAAVVVIWLFRQLKLPAILAYLVAGMLVGEHGLALVSENIDYEKFAELGIVFLLFTLGLEFSVPQLVAMRHWVFAIGGLQVLLSTVIFGSIAMMLGVSAPTAVVIAGTLALSSTAIVIRQLSETGGIKRKSGQIAVAVLLFQDIAVVPLLIAIPLLASNDTNSMMWALSWAFLKGIFVVALLLFLGKRVLPLVFNGVAKVKNSELFVLTTLLVTLLASGLTQWFGLSMALGAFLAGMMLGESQYKHQLEADIRPYRDILLGLFFVTVGMKLDFHIILANPMSLIAILVVFMTTKTLIVFALSRFAGELKKDSWAAGFMLAQMGEFGFVLIALANQFNLLTDQQASLILVSGVLSMLVTPFMVQNARSWAVKISNEKLRLPDISEQQAITEHLSNHVIICGFGRVGQTVSRFLRKEHIDYVAIDIDPLRVKESIEAGEHVIFGSSRQREILQAAHIEKAQLVVVAFGEDMQSIEVIHKARSLNPKIPILVRTRNDDNLDIIKKAGASEVVPEILEGSLMLVSQVLSLTGVPLSSIVRKLQKERKNHYNEMHGFYQGEKTNLSPEKVDKLEFSHAVPVGENAFAINKSIAELNLAERKVEITAIRKENDELIEEPSPNYTISFGDSIILRGRPRRVERVERYLLEGD